MSFTRFLLLFASIIISAMLWMWGVAVMPLGKGSAFAALACSEAIPDRMLRERLENQGITGLVSESGQLVLLDSFESMEQIPLDEYHLRILPFDPRNDGYAEKLRSLFVREEKRFIYIPLDSPTVSQLAAIKGKLAAAMGDIPYSFYAVTGRPASFFLILFCLAAITFCIIPPLRSVLRPQAAFLIPLLPALAPLVLGGAAGFALASLLAGCAALLLGPCLEWLIVPRKQRSMLGWLFLPFIIIFYGGILFFSGLPVFFMLMHCIFFCGILAFSLRDAYHAAVGAHGAGGLRFRQRNSGHLRFSPVPILRRRTHSCAFAWTMLPFTAMAAFLVCMGYIESVIAPPSLPLVLPAGSVTEADYGAHCRFQAAFSLRSLNEPWADASPEGSMAAYELAPDGLLGQANNGLSTDVAIETGLPPGGIPPFTLGALVRYLDTAGYETGTDMRLIALLPLLFLFPLLLPFPGKRQGLHIKTGG